MDEKLNFILNSYYNMQVEQTLSYFISAILLKTSRKRTHKSAVNLEGLPV